METHDRRFYNQPTAEGFRGRFERGFFGTNIGEAMPKGRLPSTLRVCSANGLVTELHYALWNPPDALFDVLSEELESRLGSPNIRGDRPRTVVWRAQGVEARLVCRMEDPGLKLTLTIVGKASPTQAEEESLETLKAQFEQTFHELERTEVRRTDDGGLEFVGDLRGSDGGVVVEWKGPALVDGVLHRELVDQVLSEIRDESQLDDEAAF